MSYSFNIRATGAAAAVAALAAKFDEVEDSQPVHAIDRTKAEANATSILELIGEPPEGHELSVTANGYVQWQGEPAAENLTGVSAGVTVHFVPKGA